MTAFIGVRISWLMFARKLLFQSIRLFCIPFRLVERLGAFRNDALKVVTVFLQTALDRFPFPHILAKLLGHVVELTREIPDLVLLILLDLVVQIAGSHDPRAFLQGRDRAQGPPLQQEEGEE